MATDLMCRGKRSIRVDLQLFASERTEPATPRRRQDARRRGQVARTGELSTALVLVVSFATLFLLSGYSSRKVALFTKHVLSDGIMEFDRISTGQVASVLIDMVLIVVTVVWPVLAAAITVGFASQALQTGFLVAAEPLKPKAERINPISGLKRILSKRSLAELVKSILKILVVGMIAYQVLRPRIPQFVGFLEIDTKEAVTVAGRLVFELGIWVGAALVVLSLLDYFYQRWEFERSIRMSKQEVREELRQTEGDPQIRSKVRQRQRQLATVRMMAEVPRADVVITNPVHLAVALAYDMDAMEAPMVVAKGAGKLAQRIKETAEENGVAIVENVWLARSLYETVAIGASIPEELYQAVAEALAFVYRLRRAGAG